MAKQCDTYEEVATYLLNEFASQFGLTAVEGKQKVVGQRSGTTWEIDAKGIRAANDGFVIVECRRHTQSGQKQEQVAAVAYRIQDTGAKGGIIVTPIGLQEGGKKIAAAEGIVEVKMTPDSTTRQYMLQFLNKVMIGIEDVVPPPKESISITIQHKDGTTVHKELL